MENERSQREKAVAALSIRVLTAAVSLTLSAGVLAVVTRDQIASILLKAVPRDELSVLTNLFVVSIPTVVYEVFFISLLLILILKEVLIRAKRVTLVVNILAGTIVLFYVIFYLIAVCLPVMGSIKV